MRGGPRRRADGSLRPPPQPLPGQHRPDAVQPVDRRSREGSPRPRGERARRRAGRGGRRLRDARPLAQHVEGARGEGAARAVRPDRVRQALHDEDRDAEEPRSAAGDRDRPLDRGGARARRPDEVRLRLRGEGCRARHGNLPRRQGAHRAEELSVRSSRTDALRGAVVVASRSRARHPQDAHGHDAAPARRHARPLVADLAGERRRAALLLPLGGGDDPRRVLLPPDEEQPPHARDHQGEPAPFASFDGVDGGERTPLLPVHRGQGH